MGVQVIEFFLKLMRKVNGRKAFLLILQGLYMVFLVVGLVDVYPVLAAVVLLEYALIGILLVKVLAARVQRAYQLIAVVGFLGTVLIFGQSAHLIKPVFGLGFVYSIHRYSLAVEGVVKLYFVLERLFNQIAMNVTAFGNNFAFWLERVLAGHSIRMQQPAMFVWGLAVFAAAVWFGWFLHWCSKPLLAVIPGVLMLGLVVDVSGQPVVYFALLLALSFLVTAVFSHRVQEVVWERRGIGYSLELRLDVTWTALLVCAILFITAFMVPSVSAKEIMDKIDEWRKPGVEAVRDGESGGYQEVRATLVNEVGNGDPGILPSSHLILTPPELLETELFQVQTKNSAQPFPLDQVYWRIKTLADYTGYGWLAGNTEPLLLSAGEILAGDFPDQGELVQVDIQVQSPQIRDVLIYSDHLVSVDQPVELQMRKNQPKAEEVVWGEIDVDEYSVTLFRSRIGVQEENADIDTDYDAWVRQTYLDLPDRLPIRVTQLAQAVVQGRTDPHGMALVIESYLRGIPYSLDVGVPPENRDVVDYFLFDLKRGYCDYYASSMVVLARSVGLPARLVVGYAPGEYDPESGTVLITGLEGHSWAEVYFSDLGWVAFEPTAGRPPLDRSRQDGEMEGVITDEETDADTRIGLRFSRKVIWFGAAAVLLLAIVILGMERLWYQSRTETTLLMGAKKRFFLLSDHFVFASSETLTLQEIQVWVDSQLIEWADKLVRRRLVDWMEMVVRENVTVFSAVAYEGLEVETLDKSQLVRNLVNLKRLVGVFGLIELFYRE